MKLVQNQYLGGFMGISSPHLHRATSSSFLKSGIVAASLFAACGTMAQTDTAPTAIEVRPGDTFSAIAARYTGGVNSWSKLYDAKLSRLRNPNLITPGMRFELVTAGGGRQYLRVMAPGAVAVAAAPTPALTPVPKAAPALAAAPSKPPVAAAVVPPPPPVAAAPAPELVIGVLPFIGASALMSQYESMKTYFEKNGQKVRIVLPASFKAFFESTLRGDFDLSVSAPHFARVAQLDGGMVPLAMYEPRINAQFVTPVDAPLASPKDVKGKSVAFANPTSLVAMYGQQWLRQQGMEAGKDYEIKGARTDMGVGRMLLSGDAVAAVMSGGEFRSLPVEESGRLKITEVFARIPNFILLGNPRLGKERLAKLKQQLLGFLADKDDGAAFAKAANVSAIVDADDATLRELDPFVAPTRRAMGTGN